MKIKRVTIELQDWTEIFEESCFEDQPHFITFKVLEEDWKKEDGRIIRTIKKAKFFPQDTGNKLIDDAISKI